MLKFLGATLYCAALVVLSFALGCIIGETMSPISGISVHTLEARAARLEARAEALADRCRKLESLAEEVRQATAANEMRRERTSRR